MTNQLKTCLICNKIFDRPLRSKTSNFKISWPNYLKIKFCSSICRGKWKSQTNSGTQNYNYRGGKSKCNDCNKDLPQRYSWKKTPRCMTCYYKFINENPELNPVYKGGTHCIDCSISIYHGQKRCWSCYNKSRDIESKDNLDYFSLHYFIKNKLGREPKQCSNCGKIGSRPNKNWNIQWANKSHKYMKSLDDWTPLCVPCHKRYDIEHSKIIVSSNKK